MNPNDHLMSLIREAFRQGAQGALHELRLFARPWGFSLGEINTRVYLWQGGEDGTVPPSMGKYIAEQLPDCQYRFWPDEGHFSLAIDHGAGFLEMLRESLIKPM